MLTVLPTFNWITWWMFPCVFHCNVTIKWVINVIILKSALTSCDFKSAVYSLIPGESPLVIFILVGWGSQMLYQHFTFHYCHLLSAPGSWGIVWGAGQLWMAHGHHMATEGPLSPTTATVSLPGPPAQHSQKCTCHLSLQSLLCPELHVPGTLWHMTFRGDKGHLRHLLRAALVVFVTLVFWGRERWMNELISLFSLLKLWACGLSYSNAGEEMF